MLIGCSILIWFELSISMSVSQLNMDWLVILFYVLFNYTNLLLMFAFLSIVLCFCGFFCCVYRWLLLLQRRRLLPRRMTKGWRWTIPSSGPSTFWKIHSVLHKGNHHSGKICRLSGFKGHFHSKLLWGQRLG